ncbi:MULTISPECIES: ATP-binding protein [unclassified Leptolyngbya]|uniref:sensor histidine kinase n=1 Tax=unclassified Leptolyngbya TaxID=2650499 RepID=UPI001688E737|nr:MULTISPECIES: ATP-binding protein [unclassified Leptolyngbya]MBD1911044.1 HAMP domain-containing protein [Leptolyngbya sp. FACHB-8]MBD2158290.1 HAMP domain-containing protein [Leptolyngbya sp. FACHB-16]
MSNPSTPKAGEPATSISSLKTAIAQSRPLISRLNIGTKIGIGYAIALGIATLGTVLGSIVGNQIQHRATEHRETFHQAEKLIDDLQIALLEVRTNEQRLMRLVQDPQELPFQYSMANMRLDRAEILLADFRKTMEDIQKNPEFWGRGAEVAEYLITKLPIASDYLNHLNELMNQRFSPSSEATSATIEAELDAFTQSSSAQRLDEFSSQLNELVTITQRLEQQAEEDVLRAEQLRQQILFVSMALSGLLAIFFATYTSRAIASPLRAVTNVARRVTEDADFDLRAPVTATDEVGVLAHSLNKLIQRVKDLLKDQKAAAEEQRRLQQEQLLQAEKMSSLGRMLAGVAHEINNPVNFMYGNLIHASEYINDLMKLVKTYEATVPNPDPKVVELAEAIDLEFLSQDLPKLLTSMQIGADRTRQIVLSLKNFSRMDEEGTHPVNLPECLDSTLLILNNRIKRGITIERQYDEVPLVQGYSGLLYQVFMNLMVNALDALEEKQPVETERGGTALSAWAPTVRIHLTRSSLEEIQVTISDNGCGIPTERLSRIFDAFYTSKPVGVGTGLGLSITKDIIETKHHGRIECHSVIGEGTRFVVSLPIQQPIQSSQSTASKVRKKAQTT